MIVIIIKEISTTVFQFQVVKIFIYMITQKIYNPEKLHAQTIFSDLIRDTVRVKSHLRFTQILGLCT